MGYCEKAWTSRTHTPRAVEGPRSVRPGKTVDAEWLVGSRFLVVCRMLYWSGGRLADASIGGAGRHFMDPRDNVYLHLGE